MNGPGPGASVSCAWPGLRSFVRFVGLGDKTLAPPQQFPANLCYHLRFLFLTNRL